MRLREKERYSSSSLAAAEKLKFNFSKVLQDGSDGWTPGSFNLLCLRSITVRSRPQMPSAAAVAV
jgi:hypothetical protein